MSDWLREHFGEAVAAITALIGGGGLAGWVVARATAHQKHAEARATDTDSGIRQRDADVDALRKIVMEQAESYQLLSDKCQDMQRTLLEYQHGRIADMEARAKLQRKVDALEEQLIASSQREIRMQRRMAQMEAENAQLQQYVATLETQICELRNENKQLKRSL